MQEATITKIIELQQILCSIPQASTMIGRCVATIYELIGAGKIKAVKSDGRTLVVVQSLHDYANSLPEAKVAPPRYRKPPRQRIEEAQLPRDRGPPVAPPRQRKPQHLREAAANR
jgi:hypothetical protein